MTGQTLLDTMEVLNQELQLQAGEIDVTRGLLALNIAQDFFESAAAKRPNTVGSSYGTVTQTANQEFTLYPAGLLRIDRMDYIDPATSRPAWKLAPRYEAGSHSPNSTWVNSLVTSSSTGKPKAYWANGTQIWWDPLPDTTNTVRWYGLQAATDITASGTFLYPDIVRLPITTFAVTILKLGVDDDPGVISGLSQNLFEGTLDLLANPIRDGARGLNYAYDQR